MVRSVKRYNALLLIYRGVTLRVRSYYQIFLMVSREELKPEFKYLRECFSHQAMDELYNSLP
jgi:hypothetical protein